MKSVTKKAYGKVNLFLSVGKKRPDGRHDVENVMCRVGIYDTVTVTVSDTPEIRITCENVSLPLNEDNIAYLAAKRYLEKTCIAGGVDIKIEKRIPVKGGMAGGSTDAAAVLEAMNEIYGALDFATLSEIAASLGADVPFFLYGDKVMLGRGTGIELLEIGRINFDIYGVFVCYGEKQSTGSVYGMLDTLRGENVPLKTCDKIARAIAENDFFAIMGEIENDFELVCPTFNEVKSALEGSGCQKVFLCGSGPTVCGIFQSEYEAKAAAKKLPYNTFVCKIGI